MRSVGTSGLVSGGGDTPLPSDGDGPGLWESRNLRAIQARNRAGRPLAAEPAEVELSPASAPGCVDEDAAGWVTSSLHIGH